MKRKKEFLIAIDKLINHYEKQSGEIVNAKQACQLCVATCYAPRFFVDCMICPWVIFNKAECQMSNFSIDNKTKRLKRLYSWKRKIKAMMPKNK